MILLDAMDFQNRCIVHGEMDKHHWPKEGKDHGRCRRGRRAFIAGALLLDSRVVDVPMAYNLTCVILSSLKLLFFNNLNNES